MNHLRVMCVMKKSQKPGETENIIEADTNAADRTDDAGTQGYKEQKCRHKIPPLI